jgi:hypothetical protein
MKKVEVAARHPATPPERLRLIAINVGERSYPWLVANPSCPPDILDDIARSPLGHSLASSLLRHRNVATATLLRFLSAHEEIRACAISHPSFPKDMAFAIAESEEESDFIRSAAVARLLTDPSLSFDEKIRLTMLHADARRAYYGDSFDGDDAIPMLTGYLPSVEEN